MRKASNIILEKLRDTIKMADLDDDTIERLLSGQIVRLKRCDHCGNIFNEDDAIGVDVDLEDYYGVGSDFPDHHHGTFAGCPKCECTDLETLGLFEKEDFPDLNLYESSQWRHYSGERLGKNMDDGYQQKIQTKLLPLLNAYGIDITPKPFIDRPGKQSYIGDTESGDEVVLSFYNAHEDKKENREGKHDMLVNVMFNGNKEDAGVIQLDNVDGIDDAFALITMTLENLGFNINGKSKDKEEDKKDKYGLNGGVYDDILNFKHSLREEELLEILKED